MKTILEFIFPPICGICEKIGKEYICEKCYKNIEKYFYENNRENYFHLLKYTGIIREKMIDYKFNDKSYLYEMFCEILLKNKKACDFLKNYDIIISVPIHKKRKYERGYNQSELIAKKISKKLSIPVENVLKKEVYTVMQSSLGRNERYSNVKNVYKVENIEKIKDKRIVILDDIYTTGATAKECKKMLLEAGAKQVGIFTIAKD